MRRRGGSGSPTIGGWTRSGCRSTAATTSRTCASCSLAAGKSEAAMRRSFSSRDSRASPRHASAKSRHALFCRRFDSCSTKWSTWSRVAAPPRSGGPAANARASSGPKTACSCCRATTSISSTTRTDHGPPVCCTTTISHSFCRPALIPKPSSQPTAARLPNRFAKSTSRRCTPSQR